MKLSAMGNGTRPPHSKVAGFALTVTNPKDYAVAGFWVRTISLPFALLALAR